MNSDNFNSNRVTQNLKQHWSTMYHSATSNQYLTRTQCQHITNSDFSLRATKHNIPTTLLALKYDWYKQFVSCMDIIAYDQPGKVHRFTIIYYILSLTYNSRLQLITQTNELKGLDSIVMLYSSANWSEREVYDMYGIIFLYHPDLRRILTDYGFMNFPLRKDFPLTGYYELVYSDYSKMTEYRTVELSQDFRKTTYTKPWNNSNIWSAKNV